MLTAIYPQRRPSAWERKAGMLLITELMSANSSVGNRDATGFGTLDGTVKKWEASAQEMVYTSIFNEAVDSIIDHPFIAHVRTTSSGLTAMDGAHPFHVGHVLLAHNGTLTGYQKFVKEYATILNDTDPVDSHILTCILAQTCGTKEVTPELIGEALKELGGSYALLIIDTSGPSMWAIPGNNPLYTAVVGPYLVVNTNSINLKRAVGLTTSVIELLYKKTLPPSEVSQISSFTINTIGVSGITKVGVAPRLSMPQTMGTWSGELPWRGRKGKESVATRAAEGVFSIVSGCWVTMWEITTACDAIGIDHWWEMDEDEMGVLEASLSDESMNPTQNQTNLWEAILGYISLRTNPYKFLGGLLDLEFPYSLNSEERLTTIYNTVKERVPIPLSIRERLEGGE